MKKSNKASKAFETLSSYLVQQDYHSDFTAPEDFIINQLSGPYRELLANQYKSVSKSQVVSHFDGDDTPHLCSCQPDTGCDRNCQNRILYM